MQNKDLNTKPEVLRAHEMMASDPHQALTMIDQVLAGAPDDPQAHYVRGQILAFALERPRDGKDALERAYKDVVENMYFVPGVHRAFAQCLAELGEHQRAIEVLDGCLQLYPDELDGWIDRGNSKKELGDFLGAVADTDEVLTRNSTHPLALYNRACFLTLAGKHDDALAALERLFAVVPDDRASARQDDDFRALHQNPRFQQLVG